MKANIPYRVDAFGDTGLRVGFGEVIDDTIHGRVLALYQLLRTREEPLITDLVPAYSCLTLFYDPARPDAFQVLEALVHDLIGKIDDIPQTGGRLVEIPVCYDPALGLDIGMAASRLGLTMGKLADLHQSTSYRVYMMGFLPGFAYLGPLPPALQLPRKPRPETVQEGSVGMAGIQTGIYPMNSPGGWHIIGKTPIRLFDPDSPGLSLLETGDQVRFYSIYRNEFENYPGRHS